MSDEMLSQEEINALLQGASGELDVEDESDDEIEESLEEEISSEEESYEPEDSEEPQEPEEPEVVEDSSEEDVPSQDVSVLLTEVERDALGEIGNISMGTAATTLSTLLNKKVNITTPEVGIVTPEELAKEYQAPLVAVDVGYKEGLEGFNVMLLKSSDAIVITDLMMGKAEVDRDREVTEMDLSAVGEAMNQMMGSSSTSLSSMLDKRIDIKPPIAEFVTIEEGTKTLSLLKSNEPLIKISFRMVIEGYLDSNIMQLVPIEFGKNIVRRAMGWDDDDVEEANENIKEANKMKEDKAQEEEVHQESTPVVETKTQQQEATVQSKPVEEPQDMYYNTERQDEQRVQHVQQVQSQEPAQEPVAVSKPQFESFDTGPQVSDQLKLDLVGDIPVELTVELGRTNKKIGEILEFGIGTVIDLDKLVGEPLNIFANSKLLAKGEVVVIDDNFGVRLTEIDSEKQKII